MQFPACDLTLHMIRHRSERPDEVTVRGLCLVSAAADSAIISVDRVLLLCSLLVWVISAVL